jgi:hypothetical protein
MSTILISSPPAPGQNFIVKEPDNTYCIEVDIHLPELQIRFDVKQLVIFPGVTLECRHFHVVSKESFLTLGVIDAETQYLKSSEIYLGGETTTEIEDVVLLYENGLYAGNAIAMEEFGRLAKRLCSHNTYSMLRPCRFTDLRRT